MSKQPGWHNCCCWVAHLCHHLPLPSFDSFQLLLGHTRITFVLGIPENVLACRTAGQHRDRDIWMLLCEWLSRQQARSPCAHMSVYTSQGLLLHAGSWTHIAAMSLLHRVNTAAVLQPHGALADGTLIPQLHCRKVTYPSASAL
jgi:hypothetical protein